MTVDPLHLVRMLAVQMVGAEINRMVKDKLVDPELRDHGRGSVKCPKCEAALRFVYDVRRAQGGRKRLSFRAKCDTSDCFQFFGDQ